MVDKEEKEQRWQWEVENATRTLIEAAKIKRDKKLYQAAINEMKKQKTDMTEIISDNS